MRSAHDLETSNNIPAVPLNLRLHAAPSDSSKSYPLTRADGYAWLFTRRTGSEVMDPLARPTEEKTAASILLAAVIFRCAEVVERSFFRVQRTEGRIARRGSRPYLLLRRVTSWAPPSTMETEETRVSLASRIRSGMLVTPTLHMVDLTLYMEASTLSCREPA